MTSVLDLITAATADTIFARAIEIATARGLPVTNWRDISPARIRFWALAELRAAGETLRAGFARSAWITTARGAWKTFVAAQMYGVTRGAASYATPTVTLSNTTTGTRKRYYVIDVHDLVFSSSVTGKTYHNSTSGALDPGSTLTLSLIADEAGSDSSVGADEIDVLQSALTGVEIVSSTASYANDEQSEPALEEECLATTAARSDHGPPDAFEYWSIQSSDEITRAKSDPDSATGVHTVYVAGPSAAISDAALADAQEYIELYACPGCITPIAARATRVSTNVTVAIAGFNLPTTLQTAAVAKITDLLQTTRGGSTLTLDTIRGELYYLATSPEASTGGGGSQVVITFTTPTADLAFDLDEVPIAGTVTVGV